MKIILMKHVFCLLFEECFRTYLTLFHNIYDFVSSQHVIVTDGVELGQEKFHPVVLED